MNKIFLHAFANIRKSKGHSMSLFLMFLISGLLLNAGLLVYVNFGSFFDRLTKELNTSDVCYLMPDRFYNDNVDEYIKTNNNIVKLQKEQSLWVTATTKVNDNNQETYLINDTDHERNISKWKFIGKHLPSDGMSIYLPYVEQVKDGYQLNDKFSLYVKDVKLTFKIKGFIEDAYFSSPEIGVNGIYVPHETYTKITDQLGNAYQATLIYANVKENNLHLENGIKKRLTKVDTTSLTDSTNRMYRMDKIFLKMSRILMANLLSVIIVIFSVMIVGVCLIVVRFRIGNSIEDDMPKIGSLKAIGYTSGQIILSIITQFGMIAFAGSIIGNILSYMTTPFLSEVFEKQSGLKWIQGFDGKISSISICSIVLFVILISYLTSRKIKKIQPIIALRGGIVTHNFRKNYMPLDNSKGGLVFLLSLKALLQNKRQNIMIAIILIAVSFCGAFAVSMFYNTTVDIQAFKEVPGMEIANAEAVFKPDTNNTEMVKNIREMKHVRKTNFLDHVVANIEDNSIYFEVMNDFNKKETDTIYEGRYPLHVNEISISGYLGDLIDKKIGDTVSIKIGNEKAKYIITGLSSGANYGGRVASMTYDGMKKLNPKFKQQSLEIYLDKGTDSAKYAKELKRLYPDSFVEVVDLDKAFDEGTSVYTSMVSKIGIIVLIVTIVVVILVLYFVINSSVTRRRRELGIQKAIGFTTLQLMNQISLGFLSPVIIGVFIGSLLGTTQVNRIMSVAMRSAGVMKASYVTQPIWAITFGVAILITSYVTSMLITYRIRKISAYSLVSE